MTLSFALLGPAYLVAATWPLVRIDLRERRLPNRLTLPAFPITLVGQIIASIYAASSWHMLVAILVTCVTFTICVLLNRHAGLGMGDVKLFSAITLGLAWFNPLLPALAASVGLLLSGVVALTMLVLRKASMGSSIALGPYLLFGFLVSLIGLGWS
jgi:leader peptidase (prepilin peptidase)/N-methyltransferase